MLSDRGRFICTLEDRGRLVQHMALGLGRLDCPSVGVQDAKSTPEMSPLLIKSEEDCVCVCVGNFRVFVHLCVGNFRVCVHVCVCWSF